MGLFFKFNILIGPKHILSIFYLQKRISKYEKSLKSHVQNFMKYGLH